MHRPHSSLVWYKNIAAIASSAAVTEAGSTDADDSPRVQGEEGARILLPRGGLPARPTPPTGSVPPAQLCPICL